MFCFFLNAGYQKKEQGMAGGYIVSSFNFQYCTAFPAEAGLDKAEDCEEIYLLCRRQQMKEISKKTHQDRIRKMKFKFGGQEDKRDGTI